MQAVALEQGERRVGLEVGPGEGAGRADHEGHGRGRRPQQAQADVHADRKAQEVEGDGHAGACAGSHARFATWQPYCATLHTLCTSSTTVVLTWGASASTVYGCAGRVDEAHRARSPCLASTVWMATRHMEMFWPRFVMLLPSCPCSSRHRFFFANRSLASVSWEPASGVYRLIHFCTRTGLPHIATTGLKLLRKHRAP